VAVYVDAAVIADPEHPGHAHLEDGPAVAGETIRRVTCDCALVDGGRQRRTISAPLRRALQARDGGCRFPGCTNRITQGHHIKHWASGGETTLSNVTSLCNAHHVMLHEGRYTVEATDDGLRFRTPDGRVIAQAPPLPAAPPLVGEAQMPPATWDGTPVDYDWAVCGLLAQVTGSPYTPSSPPA
jgi:hypothetical protein